jgi:hypothetical protein
MYDDFKDFLVVHYQTGRKDSDFRKWISTGETRTEFVSHIIDLCKSRSPNYHDFPQYFGTPGWPLWSWILAGIGILTPEISKQQIDYTVPNNGNYFDILKHSRDQWYIARKIDYMTNMSYHEWCNIQKSKLIHN